MHLYIKMQEELFATNKKVKVQIEESWKQALLKEFQQPYFTNIKQSLINEKKQGLRIYPPGPLIFNAFNLTPLDNVKVVILGQDPYHGQGQAHGLSFSVPDGVTPPPSLKNIYKEIKNNYPSFVIPNTGNLSNWAKQGVFLLNAMLTVQASKPASHQKLGWQNFTDAVIKTLSEKRENLVFMLWGKFAQGKANLIDFKKHLVLTSTHPSPFSAHNGFFGNQHFIKANEYLEKKGVEMIEWQFKT